MRCILRVSLREYSYQRPDIALAQEGKYALNPTIERNENTHHLFQFILWRISA